LRSQLVHEYRRNGVLSFDWLKERLQWRYCYFSPVGKSPP
jgi:hypothetical protein